ncbi:MAG: hypothetical protein AAF766_18290 [Cyanobacteria bacterium P01_D01_bin.14]
MLLKLDLLQLYKDLLLSSSGLLQLYKKMLLLKLDLSQLYKDLLLLKLDLRCSTAAKLWGMADPRLAVAAIPLWAALWAVLWAALG